MVISPSSVGTHTKTVSGTFSEGGTVTYTVVISNPSASAQLDNPGDEFTDVLPAGLTLVTASATSGTATTDVPNRTVHWNGSIAAGGSVTITITALVNTGTAGQTLSNQGTVFFDADGNGTNESSILTDDPSTAAANDPTSFRVPDRRRDPDPVGIRPAGSGAAAGQRRPADPAAAPGVTAVFSSWPTGQ